MATMQDSVDIALDALKATKKALENIKSSYKYREDETIPEKLDGILEKYDNEANALEVVLKYYQEYLKSH
jgi:hypothetical protein